VECKIYDCPRNIKEGQCELSLLPEDDPHYRNPKKCSHRIYKLKSSNKK